MVSSLGTCSCRDWKWATVILIIQSPTLQVTRGNRADPKSQIPHKRLSNQHIPWPKFAQKFPELYGLENEWWKTADWSRLAHFMNILLVNATHRWLEIIVLKYLKVPELFICWSGIVTPKNCENDVPRCRNGDVLAGKLAVMVLCLKVEFACLGFWT